MKMQKTLLNINQKEINFEVIKDLTPSSSRNCRIQHIHFISQFQVLKSFQLKWIQGLYKKKQQKTISEQQSIDLINLQCQIQAYSRQMMHKCKHIVRIHDIWKSKERIYIRMQKCGANLKDFIMDFLPNSSNSPQLALDVICQIILGLAEAKIQLGVEMHRDIKPENIFIIHKDFNSPAELHIADFGCCSFEQYSKLNVGTPLYKSPQVHFIREHNLPYDSKCDIFPLGVIIYHLIKGRFIKRRHLQFPIYENIVEKINMQPSQKQQLIHNYYQQFEDMARGQSNQSGQKFINLLQNTKNLSDNQIQILKAVRKMVFKMLKVRSQNIKEDRIGLCDIFEQILLMEDVMKKSGRKKLYDELLAKNEQLKNKPSKKYLKEQTMKAMYETQQTALMQQGQ